MPGVRGQPQEQGKVKQLFNGTPDKKKPLQCWFEVKMGTPQTSGDHVGVDVYVAGLVFPFITNDYYYTIKVLPRSCTNQKD